MPSERDNTTENPYEAPRHPADDKVPRRKRKPLPWWARPDLPSIFWALPIVFVVIVGVVVALLLPMIQWLRQ